MFSALDDVLRCSSVRYTLLQSSIPAPAASHGMAIAAAWYGHGQQGPLTSICSLQTEWESQVEWG